MAPTNHRLASAYVSQNCPWTKRNCPLFRRFIKSIKSPFVLKKEEGESGDLRGDGNLGPCLLLDLLQVAALLTNQPAHEAVVGEDFQGDFLRPTHTNTHTQVEGDNSR